MGTDNGHTGQVEKGSFWLPNALFFTVIHLGALLGCIYLSPPSSLCTSTIILTILCWQLPCFGITIGYHRLWSHRAFRAHKAVRFVLAMLGTMAFQGSIKGSSTQAAPYKFFQDSAQGVGTDGIDPHRFTDDPVHDPYAATRGLFFSHMGWIFRKPAYTKLQLIEKTDLDRDPIVRFQHRYYVPLALFTGLVMPTVIAATWGDAMGGYIWGGLVGRVLVWHCTFLVNSLAHWEGLQPYTDEVTARGNIVMAMLTCGEGNHNFHAFPHDFRAGPNKSDWDPSKWTILMFQKLGLASGLRRARKDDIDAAKAWIKIHHHEPFPSSETSEEDSEPTTSSDSSEMEKWSLEKLMEKAEERACLLVIDGYVVDASKYIGEHPGGALFLQRHAVRQTSDNNGEEWRNATWAFGGGMNVHSRIAKRKMMSLRIARLIE